LVAAGVAGAALLALAGTAGRSMIPGFAEDQPGDESGPIYVYVSAYARGTGPDSAALNVFRLDPESGALSPVQQVTGPSPSWIEIDPLRRFLYACYSLRDGDRRVGSLESYSIDPGTGRLTFLNRLSLGDSGPAQLAVAPDGRQVVVANYYYGQYVVLPVDPDGRLGAVSSVVTNTGRGPEIRQDSAHPHAVVFAPGGGFLGAADLGIDKVQSFRLTGGGLLLVSEAAVAPGMGPRHVAFSLDGRTLFTNGELDGNITAFRFDTETGAIGQLLQTVSSEPPGYSGQHSGAELAVHPSGDFLYASNRGSQTVAGFRIERSTGTLSPAGFASQGVQGPTNFAIAPSGRWLFVNSSADNSIVRFTVDLGTGALTPGGQAAFLAAPNVMVFRRPGKPATP
jgi:6-phosphogluconolactonase (cycloisomerase 2 family)